MSQWLWSMLQWMNTGCRCPLTNWFHFFGICTQKSDYWIKWLLPRLSLSSKEEGFVCAQGSAGCSVEGHSSEGMAGTLPRIGKENTRGPTTLLSPFSLFLKSESPARGLVPPTFGMGLPTLVKHFQEYSLIHSQRRGLAVSLRPGPSCFVFALKKKKTHQIMMAHSPLGAVFFNLSTPFQEMWKLPWQKSAWLPAVIYR